MGLYRVHWKTIQATNCFVPYCGCHYEIRHHNGNCISVGTSVRSVSITSRAFFGGGNVLHIGEYFPYIITQHNMPLNSIYHQIPLEKFARFWLTIATVMPLYQINMTSEFYHCMVIMYAIIPRAGGFWQFNSSLIWQKSDDGSTKKKRKINKICLFRKVRFETPFLFDMKPPDKQAHGKQLIKFNHAGLVSIVDASVCCFSVGVW